MKKSAILALSLLTLSTGAQAFVDASAMRLYNIGAQASGKAAPVAGPMSVANCRNVKTFDNIAKKSEQHFEDLYIKIELFVNKAVVNDKKTYVYSHIGAGPNNSVKRVYKMTEGQDNFVLDIMFLDNGRAASAVITGPRKTFHWDCR